MTTNANGVDGLPEDISAMFAGWEKQRRELVAALTKRRAELARALADIDTQIDRAAPQAVRALAPPIAKRRRIYGEGPAATMAFLKENPGAKAVDIRRAGGVDFSTLYRMEKRGYVRCERGAEGVRWFAVEPST